MMSDNSNTGLNFGSDANVHDFLGLEQGQPLLLQKDFTGLSSQQLLTLAGEGIIEAWQNKTDPTQALVYAFVGIFGTNFEANAQIAFGEKFDIQKAKVLEADILGGNYGVLPDFQFTDSSEFNGAYAESLNTVYMDSVFVSQNAANPNVVGKVLVEELGHRIDAFASPVDSMGDEGKILAKLVNGEQLSSAELTSLKAEGDHSFTNINGQLVAVEMDAVSGTANTLQTAKNIGVLGSTSQVFTGFVGDSGVHNYIKFQVTTPSLFAVELSGLVKDANVRLLDAQGNFIQASYNKGTAIDSFQHPLGVGTYYAHIYREAAGDNTNYTLKLSAPTASVKVTSPNGGNSIARGGVANITWQDNIAENVRIDLYKGGIFYRNITASTPSTGSFNWSVPTDIVTNLASGTPNWVSLGSDYQIRVQSIANSTIFDSSDANFKITGKQSNDLLGTLFVLGQNAVKAGATVNYSYMVRNDGTDAVGASKVGLYLSSDAKSTTGDVFLGEINVGGLDAKTTSAVFKGTLTLPSQGNIFYKGDKSYFVKAVADYKNVIVETNEANNAGQSLGGDYGAIAVTDTTASVRVTSPNGGNGIVRGGVANITWQDNIAENVRIDLYKGGIFYRNITASTPSTGSFNWSVPTDIVTNLASSTPNWVSLGSDYQIRVQSVANSAIFDSSDANFSITGKQSNDLFGSLFVLGQNAVKAGDTVNYSYKVRNDGTDAVGAFKVGLYLSTNATSTTGDLFLGEVNVGGLAAKSTSALLNGTVTLPSQGNIFYKGDKSYFVKAIADYKNVIVETNEANNAGQVVGNDYGAIAVTGTTLIPVIADNTQDTARNIGTLTTTQTFNDLVGVNDKEDWYSFYIAEPGAANIVLTSNKGATVEFYKGTSMFSRSSTMANLTRSEYIYEPGQYFVKIGQNSLDQDSNYSTALSATSSVVDLGSLSGTRNVAATNNIVYYRFKLTQNSIVTASSNFPNAVSFDVRDSSYSKTVGSWLNAGTLLNAGTYYLAVSNIPGAVVPTSFTLNLQATPSSRYDNAGLNYLTARDLGTLVGSNSVTDYIDRNDKYDYYSFTVGSKSSVSLNVAAITGSATVGVSLVNDKYASIGYSSGNVGAAPKPLTATLEAGKYYVTINDVTGTTDAQYRFDVNVQSLVAGDAIANSYDQIKDLGYLAPNTPVTLKDVIGGSDPADWMKFNVGTLGNVSTAFSGLTTPITLQLSRIEANGSLTSISSQNSGGQANWTPVFSNLVGNYALVVSSSNSTSTPYALNLSTVSTNVAPTNVKWNFSGTYQSNQDVIVTGTVSDANGALDIDEAKFYLQSKDGSRVIASK